MLTVFATNKALEAATASTAFAAEAGVYVGGAVVSGVALAILGALGYRVLVNVDHEKERELQRQIKKLPHRKVWRYEQKLASLQAHDDYKSVLRVRRMDLGLIGRNYDRFASKLVTAGI
jgi:hypothetical protein